LPKQALRKYCKRPWQPSQEISYHKNSCPARPYGKMAWHYVMKYFLLQNIGPYQKKVKENIQKNAFIG
jgi:hypothetical protein